MKTIGIFRVELCLAVGAALLTFCTWVITANAQSGNNQECCNSSDLCSGCVAVTGDYVSFGQNALYQCDQRYPQITKNCKNSPADLTNPCYQNAGKYNYYSDLQCQILKGTATGIKWDYPHCASPQAVLIAGNDWCF